MKLRAHVPCRQIFFETFNGYAFEGEEAAAGSDQDMPHTATA
jgi:hypothetical protein